MPNTKKEKELDIFEIFSILYKEKYKIILISTSFFIVGLYKSITLENNFRFSIDLYQSSDSNFLKYIELNDILKENFVPSTSSEILNVIKDEDKHILNFIKLLLNSSLMNLY